MFFIKDDVYMPTTHEQVASTTSMETYNYLFYPSIHAAATEWDIAAPKDNLFLQRDYLTLLEEYPPQNMSFGYFVFYKKNKPIGVAICQVQNFNANQNINHNREEDKKASDFFLNVGRYVRNKLAERVDFNTLVCGNLLLTGEHGFYFDSTEISSKEGFELVGKALLSAQEEFKKQGKEISIFLFKDFFDTNRPAANPLTEKNYKEFTVQPNMVMDLRPDWQNFDDYLGAMYSKYRVRAKRAFKKLGEVEKRELSLTDLEEHQPRMYVLYENIAKNVGFNMLTLHPNYFWALKKYLKDNYKVVGYFQEGELIAFYTTIVNHHELEAHFLGFDNQLNIKHQLYLNMLYDIVREGISQGVHSIVFARTALEIKSSVGAVAHEMYCYARHRFALSNKMVSPMFNFLRPAAEWKARHPFKPLETAGEKKKENVKEKKS